MIGLVLQTNDYNCGSACLAMVLGTTVEDVEERLVRRHVGELRDTVERNGGRPVIGLTSLEIACVLWDEGVAHLFLQSPGDSVAADWFQRVGHLLPCYRYEDRVGAHLDAGGVAILGVPSLRSEDADHWIVAEGRRLLDPRDDGRGPAYRSLDDFSEGEPLRVLEAILVRPA